MKNILSFFIRYSVAVNVLMITIILFGIMGLRNTKSAFFPLAETNIISGLWTTNNVEGSTWTCEQCKYPDGSRFRRVQFKPTNFLVDGSIALHGLILYRTGGRCKA